MRGGTGTATRTVGLLGSVFTYARENGWVESNPVNGIRKAADRKRERRLSESEYQLLGDLLRRAQECPRLAVAAEMARAIALTGCRRGEIIALTWEEIDEASSCLRLRDSKEGRSVRPIGLAALELLDRRRTAKATGPVFRGAVDGRPLVGFPKQWNRMIGDTPLADVTPHVLRHSYASIANDLGFTEATVAALLGHAQGSMTSRYIHSVDNSLVMAADTVAGYILGLLEGRSAPRVPYALDRASRREALNRVSAHAHAGPDLPR